jgi:Tol biopolymer transport system component
LIVIALLALVGGILLVGASRTTIPDVYGPGIDGLRAFDADGDIYVVDPATGDRKAIVTGPETDSGPWFSPDGRWIAFARAAGEDYRGMVVRPDGTGLHEGVPPLRGVTSGSWSPDGSTIAVTSIIGGKGTITISDVGRGTHETLDLDMSVDSVSWMPPDGRELVFRGVSVLPSAIYAVRPDGTGLRALTPRDGTLDYGYLGPVVSPDGRLLAYNSWDGSDEMVKVHVMDLASGTGWTIPTLGPDTHLTTPEFSPDGRSLLFFQTVLQGPSPEDDYKQVVVAPADGSAPGRALGPTSEGLTDEAGTDFSATFSPDGTKVHVIFGTEGKLWTVPVDGGPWTIEPWSSLSLPGIQRLAP